MTVACGARWNTVAELGRCWLWLPVVVRRVPVSRGPTADPEGALRCRSTSRFGIARGAHTVESLETHRPSAFAHKRTHSSQM